MFRLALLAFVVPGEIDELTRLEVLVFHVVRVHEDDAPAVIDAAITVVQTVDRGVELVVAADRHHDELTRLEFVPRDRINGELRLADTVVEFAFIARLVRQIKDVLRDALVVALEAGDHALDAVADLAVVGDEFLPRNRRALAECGTRKACDDGVFAEQVIARRLEFAA